MELDLQKQHLAIRKKLDIHKEALAKMSPDRGSSGRFVYFYGFCEMVV
jgi:hypothetical protein